ncbi:MAG: hypothetical protein ACRDZ2_07950, partial [Ilumatobacteraceae bacterium]
DAVLDRAAASVDAAPAAVGAVEALLVRQLIAASCGRLMAASGRATGPGPFVFEPDHAQRFDDLRLYVEQQHHEADLAEVGGALPSRSEISLDAKPDL